jgi:hypothetical protein
MEKSMKKGWKKHKNCRQRRVGMGLPVNIP